MTTYRIALTVHMLPLGCYGPRFYVMETRGVVGHEAVFCVQVGTNQHTRQQAEALVTQYA